MTIWKGPGSLRGFLLFAARRRRRLNRHGGLGSAATLHSALQEKETNADNDHGTHDHAQYSNSTTSTVSHLILLLKSGNGHEAVMFRSVASGVCVSQCANPDKMAAGFRFIR
jgi:hypothetical protein